MQFLNVFTTAERAGDFSQAFTRNGAPVEIFDPVTHLPFPNNTISNINPAAAGLLAFIPQPNLPGAVQNFRFITSTDNTSDNLNLRFIHNFRPRQQQQQPQQTQGQRQGRGQRGGGQTNLNIGFNWRRSGSDIRNSFPTVGGTTSGSGFNIPIGYSRSFGKVHNSVNISYNRNRIQTTPPSGEYRIAFMTRLLITSSIRTGSTQATR